jgi:hypothetical protein
MEHSMQRWIITSAAALAAVFSGAVQAAPERADLRAVCPALSEALPESLASAWQFGRPAEVRVSFVVDGGRVTQVQALTGPADYRRRVAAALRERRGRAAAGGPQPSTRTVRFASRNL